jgi:HlyD family secretion protein
VHLPRSRRLVVATAAAVVGAPGVWVLAHNPDTADSALVARVKRGPFAVTVTTSGELRARRFVQITAPPTAQQAGFWQMRIATLVPEGTVVKQGDVVAELDRSAVATKLADVTLALQKDEAKYEQAMLDSTLTLSTARENIRTMELGLEEKRLAKEQAVYEAPTVRRQAEIEYEKAERALAQAKTDYETKTEQARAKMREVGADVARQRNTLKLVEGVMAGCIIKAPTPGIVIYAKEWNGKKRTAGSQVGSWDPAVATLPDLTEMESLTYVNEIDVRKIAVGQPVVITLDADPSKQLTGSVTSAAGVGEQRPGADAKVFEVKVTLAESDTTLRPGMTTGNAIETLKVPDALYVPLEAVSSEGGVPFVYRQSGGSVTKQEVVTGAMNDDEVIIARGLAEGERVLLTPPADHDKLKLVRLPDSGAAVKTASTTAGAPPPPPSPPPSAPANQD